MPINDSSNQTVHVLTLPSLLCTQTSKYQQGQHLPPPLSHHCTTKSSQQLLMPQTQKSLISDFLPPAVAFTYPLG